MRNITLLQSPRIEIDGVTVSFPYKRADALLYYLLVRRSATRQELISLLWESVDETTGLKNLRNAIYTLKKVLGSDFLISPNKTSLAINPEWTYVCDYDRFVREGDFSAYGGDFLRGFSVKGAFCFDDWMNRVRHRIRTMFLEHLEAHARSALQEGDIELATQRARHYLCEEPSDERMSIFLMDCLMETRQYAKIATLYQKLREDLAEELGVAPMEETTLLYYEAMNRWNNDTQSTELESRPPIGRETVYNALKVALTAFLEGGAKCHAQLLVGEVGSGKSELINHFMRNHAQSDALILRCNCLQSEAHLPLAPWNKLMLALWEFARTEDISIPEYISVRLERTFSSIGKGEQGQMIHQWDLGLENQILLLLVTLSRRRRIVFIFEDIHWMDEDSQRLTDGLLRRMDSVGVMLILTTRDSCSYQQREILTLAVKDGLLREQRLSPLSLTETHELLIRELEDDVALPLAQQFYEASGGNLILFTELLYAYRHNGTWDKNLDSLSDILMERLKGLSPDGIHVAELISLFHVETTTKMLLELFTGDATTLTNALDELRNSGIIDEYWGEGDEAVYRFVHTRIRELTYNRLNYLRRQPIHLRIAQLLIERCIPLDSKSSTRIGQHFLLGGDELQSIHYRLLALDLDSVQRCEPFSQARHGDEPIEPTSLQREIDDLHHCLVSIQRSGTNQLPYNFALRLDLIEGRIALFEGRRQDAIALLGSFSDMPNRKRALPLILTSCYLLASDAIYRQAVAQAERYVSVGIGLLEQISTPIHHAQFLRLRGSCFLLRQDYEKAEYYLQEALEELGRSTHSPEVQRQRAAVLHEMGQLCRQKGEFAAGCRHFRDALTIVEEFPCAGALWIYVNYGRTAFQLDDHSRAREMFRRGYECALCSGELWGRATATAYLAYYHAQEGAFQKSITLFSEAQHILPQLSSPLEEAIVCFVGVVIFEQMEQQNWKEEPFASLTRESVDHHARLGIRKVSGLSDIYEVHELTRILRDGVGAKQGYNPWQLYSKKKHFMTE